MQTFLLISPEPWSSQRVSKHHYAIELCRLGHKVFFLNPPSISNNIAINISEVAGPYVVDGPPVFRGIRFLPKLIRNYLESNWLENLEKKIGFQFDVVWLFENSRFFDMEFAKHRLKIYHQVDLNQDHYPARAAKSADICFCTTELIKQKLLAHTLNVHKIHHGTARSDPHITLSHEHKSKLTRSHINVGYVGNLSIKYLDVELLLRLAKTFPNVSFHFIGGYTKECALRNLGAHIPNIIWWGTQPSNCILAILSEMDILLCAYQDQYSEQAASPHKFMEYFLSGKCIVSSYTDEYKDNQDLLVMVKTNRDFLQAFRSVLENLDEYNSEKNQIRRMKFAEDNSYENQIRKIFTLVKTTLR
jgi:hypothetical protein